MGKKAMLIIMDGWGYGAKDETNAIYTANTPFVDDLYKTVPYTFLKTYGKHVGLPEGQMGNSEVGHLNFGAGRIIYQELERINKAFQEGTIIQNKTIQHLFSQTNRRIHFMGLVSKGGVHSHLEHLKGLIKIAEDNGCTNNFVHCFTDGRDCDPRSAINDINELEDFLKDKKTKIASVIGRYFAMDRDNRWERIAKAYHLLLHGKGAKFSHPIDGIKNSYENGITDEFMEPISIDENGNIKEGDLVICFNFRTDRCRQITTVLTQKSQGELKPVNIDFATMTEYDASFKDINVIFRKSNLKNTLGEVLSSQSKSQLRIAETEKYPHVTFFFSGGQEAPFPKESRIMINSPKVATYDLQPEMSALKVRDAALEFIEKENPDFVCLNFANTDMVGHTGVFDAAVKAAETVDSCVKALVKSGIEKGYRILVTADHGNADLMINPDKSPHTAHTLNPVPLFLINTGIKQPINEGVLADIAPLILELMEIPLPDEMNPSKIYHE